MKKPLIKSISKYVELNSEEEHLIEKFWTKKTLGKGDYLLRNGDICRTDNFVVSGTLKAGDEPPRFKIEPRGRN